LTSAKDITKDLWEGNERAFRPIRVGVWILNNKDLIDLRVKKLIEQAEFRHALNLPNMDVNHLLVTSLLERWRSKTHTFHFPHGETIMTLEDVVVLLGLPIDGDAVIGPTTEEDIFSTFHQYLGIIPPPIAIR